MTVSQQKQIAALAEIEKKLNSTHYSLRWLSKEMKAVINKLKVASKENDREAVNKLLDEKKELSDRQLFEQRELQTLVDKFSEILQC